MPKSATARKRTTPRLSRLRDAMAIAEEQGLLEGSKQAIVRARMPVALVQRAKKMAGVDSDTELLEIALARVATEDDYVDWLSRQRGTVSKDLDLEI